MDDFEILCKSDVAHKNRVNRRPRGIHKGPWLDDSHHTDKSWGCLVTLSQPGRSNFSWHCAEGHANFEKELGLARPGLHVYLIIAAGHQDMVSTNMLLSPAWNDGRDSDDT